jgi:hypothetical protein
MRMGGRQRVDCLGGSSGITEPDSRWVRRYSSSVISGSGLATSTCVIVVVAMLSGVDHVMGGVGRLEVDTY